MSLCPWRAICQLQAFGLMIDFYNSTQMLNYDENGIPNKFLNHVPLITSQALELRETCSLSCVGG